MTEDIAKSSRAWLLNFGGGLKAAVGLHEMSQVLISPTLFDVPTMPRYCSDVVIFQKRILPVLNVPNMLLEGKKVIIVNTKVIGVAIYQDETTESANYGSLFLASMPESIIVSDEDVCDLPEEQKYWEPFAFTCFSYHDITVPIIDLAYLFSEEFSAVKQGIQ